MTAPSIPLYRALLRPARFASTGYLARADDSAAIAQAISELLLTLPGELPMSPEWGSLVRTRRWEPNDEHLAQDLRADTADAIARWEKRVSLVSVNVVRDNGAGQSGRAITLTAVFRVKATGQQAEASVALNPS